MPRQSNPVPTYRLHKQSGQAVATVRHPDGRRRDVLLGRYNTPESKVEYERLLATLRASGSPAVVAVGRPAPTPAVTVNEVLLAFLTFAAGYYRDPDGKPTSELKNYRDALRPLRKLFGPVPAAEFGPVALKAVRQAMIDGGLSRPVINKAVGRIKRVFRWAASEELVAAAVYQQVATLPGLARGRTPAREPEPVKPVDPGLVADTLPFLNRQTAAMVRVQQLTGMRPGEVCRMTAGAIDRSVAVWAYTPARHKTAHRGKARRVRLGPQAQAVLTPFLGGDPDAPLFSPRQAREERYAAMRAARRSKVTPSQVCRKKAAPNPRAMPAAAYSAHSYARAVERAARRAGVAHWHTNQLRHTHATAVRKRFGLEGAQVALGHSRADVTQVYAERDDELAERVAREVG